MNTMDLRRNVRKHLLDHLLARATELHFRDLTGPVLVFAPHFDDEVLGCGGTIAKLARQGLDVHVWFMTDGGKSHSHLMPGHQLTAMRTDESQRATEVLGIKAENVRNWGIADGALSNTVPDAVEAMKKPFVALNPSLVFAPYRHDGPADHEACSAICAELVKNASPDIVALEFPVWAWHEWPWTKMELGGRRRIPARVVRCIAGNVARFRHFKSKVDIQSFLPCKEQALREYRSQMTRILPTESWRTLPDVAFGTFLENCLLPHEVFSRTR